jgi:hypothetical protein
MKAMRPLQIISLCYIIVLLFPKGNFRQKIVDLWQNLEWWEGVQINGLHSEYAGKIVRLSQIQQKIKPQTKRSSL